MKKYLNIMLKMILDVIAIALFILCIRLENFEAYYNGIYV